MPNYGKRVIFNSKPYSYIGLESGLESVGGVEELRLQNAQNPSAHLTSMDGDLPLAFFQELYSDLQVQAQHAYAMARAPSPIDMEIVSAVDAPERPGAESLVPRDLATVDPPIADTSDSPPPQLVLNRSFSSLPVMPRVETPPPLEPVPKDLDTPRHQFVDMTEVKKCLAPVAPCRRSIHVSSPSSDSEDEDYVSFASYLFSTYMH